MQTNMYVVLSALKLQLDSIILYRELVTIEQGILMVFLLEEVVKVVGGGVGRGGGG